MRIKNHNQMIIIELLFILGQVFQNCEKMKKGRIFGHFGLFSPTPYGPRKSKFSKNEKKMPGDINHFTNAYHNCQSHEVWFLRYGVQKIEFFVILDHFFSLLLP